MNSFASRLLENVLVSKRNKLITGRTGKMMITLVAIPLKQRSEMLFNPNETSSKFVTTARHDLH